MILVCVLVGVALWNCILRWVGLTMVLPIYATIILISSVLVVVDLRCGNQYYTLFGLLFCGKYRKKQITWFSTV